MKNSFKPAFLVCTFATIICNIIGLSAISFSLNKLNKVQNFYSIVFDSRKDASNFLNLAISNLHPLQYFVSLDCIFTRSSASHEKQIIPLRVAYKKIKENRIIEDSHVIFNEQPFYFPPNSLSSTKHRVLFSLTDKIDAIRLQFSFTSDFGSLNGLYTETNCMGNIKPVVLRGFGLLLCIFILISVFSLMIRFQGKQNTLDLRTIILTVLAFVCINPLFALKMDSSYTSFDCIIYPLFTNFFRYYIFIHIYQNVKNLKFHSCLEVFIFFMSLFFFEMQYDMQKIESIKKFGSDVLPLSTNDYLLIVLLLFYVIISLYLFSFGKNWHLSHFFLCLNAEQIAFAVLNMLIVGFGRSISMNGKFIWCLVDVLTISISLLAFHDIQSKKPPSDDEKPLISESS